RWAATRWSGTPCCRDPSPAAARCRGHCGGVPTGAPPSPPGSVRELAEDRVHAALPRAMEQFELALGRGLPGFGDLDQRVEEARLVDAVGVERGTPAQAGGGDLQRFDRQLA